MNEVVARLVQGIETGDLELLRALFAVDVRWWPPPSAVQHGLTRPVVGHEDVAFLVGGGRGTFARGTTAWTIHGVLEAGDEVALRATRTARTAAGRDYENEYVLWLRTRDRVIVEAWEHVDTEHFFNQVSP